MRPLSGIRTLEKTETSTRSLEVRSSFMVDNGCRSAAMDLSDGPGFKEVTFALCESEQGNQADVIQLATVGVVKR